MLSTAREQLALGAVRAGLGYHFGHSFRLWIRSVYRLVSRQSRPAPGSAVGLGAGRSGQLQRRQTCGTGHRLLWPVQRSRRGGRFSRLVGEGPFTVISLSTRRTNNVRPHKSRLKPAGQATKTDDLSHKKREMANLQSQTRVPYYMSSERIPDKLVRYDLFANSPPFSFLPPSPPRNPNTTSSSKAATSSTPKTTSAPSATSPSRTTRSPPSPPTSPPPRPSKSSTPADSTSPRASSTSTSTSTPGLARATPTPAT